MARILQFRQLDLKYDGDISWFLQEADRRERQRTLQMIGTAVLWMAVVIITVMIWVAVQ